MLLGLSVQRGRLRRSQIRGAAVPQQGSLALCVGGGLLFHLDVRAREVLVAAHVKLQAEVSGGGKGTKFALKCLASILMLMDLDEEDRIRKQITGQEEI